MMKSKPLIPLIIWYGLTIYTLLTVAFTDIVLVDKHYANFVLIGIATASFLGGQPTGQIVTLAMLIIGFFCGAFTPSFYYFSIAGLKTSWTYLPLIICFIAINNNEIPDWWEQTLGEKETINKSDKENLS